MKRRSLIITAILCLSFFGLGAISRDLVQEMMVELGTRYYRDANMRDMFGVNSPTAYWYFTGRMEARYEDYLMLRYAEERGDIHYREPVPVLPPSLDK
jgi:AcrR family transcriptional regulator